MEAPRPTLLARWFPVLNKPLVQKAKDVLPEITKTRQGPPRRAGEPVSVFRGEQANFSNFSDFHFAILT